MDGDDDASPGADGADTAVRVRDLTMSSSFHMPSSDVDANAGDRSVRSGVASFEGGEAASELADGSSESSRRRLARVTSSASMSASSERTPSRRRAGDSPSPLARERMAVRLDLTRSMTSARRRSWRERDDGEEMGGREIFERVGRTEGCRGVNGCVPSTRPVDAA